MSFWYLQFSQKTNETIQFYYYGTSSRIVFVRFLGELKTLKRHYEINWILDWSHPNVISILFRGIGSYLKLGGQVVLCGAQSALSGWDRVKWSAKTWWAITHPTHPSPTPLKQTKVIPKLSLSHLLTSHLNEVVSSNFISIEIRLQSDVQFGSYDEK